MTQCLTLAQHFGWDIALKRVEPVFTTIKEIWSQTKQLLNKKID